jgi:hypothetical protein
MRSTDLAYFNNLRAVAAGDETGFVCRITATGQ